MISKLAIRSFTLGDVAFAESLADGVGWDTPRGLFRAILAHDPNGCFMAESAGRRAGMVTTTSYRSSAWIGNLIVVPDLQRRGIGAALMTHALQVLDARGIGTVRLEADPPGVKLYRRLGFVDEFESLRFAGTVSVPFPGRSVTAMDRADLEEVSDFDARHFGDNRHELLTRILPLSSRTAVYRVGDEITAYGIALPSTAGVRIGPWVGLTEEAAEAVLLTLLAQLEGVPVGVGVPEPNRVAVQVLTKLGFAPAASCIRMVRGERTAVGEPERQFAIGFGAAG